MTDHNPPTLGDPALQNWHIGRHIVEFEQGGQSREAYLAPTAKATVPHTAHAATGGA